MKHFQKKRKRRKAMMSKRALKAKMRQMERRNKIKVKKMMRQMVNEMIWLNEKMTQAIITAAKMVVQISREIQEKSKPE